MGFGEGEPPQHTEPLGGKLAPSSVNGFAFTQNKSCLKKVEFTVRDIFGGFGLLLAPRKSLVVESPSSKSPCAGY